MGTPERAFLPSGRVVLLTLAVLAHAGPAMAQSLRSVDPSELDAAGGAEVTVSGSGFDAGHYVTIGAQPLTSAKVVDASTIRGIAPAADPGTYDLTLYGRGGERIARIRDAVTYVSSQSSAVIKAVDPDEHSASGGSAIAILGNGFIADHSVHIGGEPVAQLSFVSGQRLEGVVPAHEPGDYDVELYEGERLVATLQDGVTYVGAGSRVRIVDVVPEQVPLAGGVRIQIVGEGFENGQAVHVDDQPIQDLVVVSSRLMEGTAPGRDEPGLAGVTIYADLTRVAFLPDAIEYVADLPAVKVGRVHPREHWRSGGSFVAIDGENFTPELVAKFGDSPILDQQFIDSTRIVGRVPPAGPELKGGGTIPTSTLSLNFDKISLIEVPGAIIYRDLEIEIVDVYPSELPTDGGRVTVVFEDPLERSRTYEVFGFAGAHRVRLDGVLHATVTLPPRDPGTYDLSIGTDTRDATATLEAAVTYVTPELPPVQDVNCEYLGGGRGARLSWSHVILADIVRIFCDGEPMAELEGDARELIIPQSEWDELTRGGDENHEFTIELDGPAVDALGARAPSVSCAIGGFTDCPLPVPTGGTGIATDELLPLTGDDSIERRTYFTLDEDATNGVRIRVHGSRYRYGGDLKARLRSILPPYDIIVDNIDVNNLPVSTHNRWTEAIFPVPLVKGDYVVGFYVDGGGDNFEIYGLTKDAAAQELPPPFPCTPYPLIQVYPLSDNIPPLIHQIRRVTTGPGVGGWLANGFPNGGGGGIGGDGAAGGANDDEITMTFACDAEDSDGHITQYIWDFGNGPAVSAGNKVTRTFPRGKLVQARVTVKDNACGSSTEFRAFGTGIPPSDADSFVALVPPRIFGIDPIPAEKKYIPNIATDVNVTFYTQVAPSNFGEITEVRFEVIHAANDNVVYLSESATMFDGHPKLSWWKATLNMSDVPNVSEARVRIRVEDSDDKEAEETWPISFCPKPAFLDLPLITTEISYNKTSHRYTVEGSFPGQLLWEHDFTIPLLVTDLVIENHAEARATTRMRLEDEKWFADEAKAVLALKLINYDIVNKQWSINPNAEIPGQVFFLCPDFDIVYELNNFKILEKDFDWTLFQGPLVSGKVLGVDLELWGKLGVNLGAALFNDIRVQLSRNQPHFQFEYTFEPVLSLGVTGGIDLVVASGLGSVGASINPTGSFGLPITVGWDGNDLGIDVGFCLGLDIDAEVHACALWGLFCVGKTFHVYENEWGGGCGGAGGIGVDPSIPQQTHPSVATSPSGGRTLLVFMKDAAPDPEIYDPELFFSQDAGAGWTAPQPLFAPTDRLRRDSSLAFMSDTQAIAVWTENTLSFAEIEQITENMEDTEATAEIFRNEEIFYSMWTNAGGWSAAEAITQNQLPEGRPEVAAAPGAGEAWCVWTRSEDSDILAPDGTMLRQKLEVVARRIGAGGSLGPVEQISDAVPGQPVADYEPEISVSPSGDTVAVVWVQDIDGLLGTSTDRALAFSMRIDGVWTPVETLDFGLLGLEMPSIALSSDNDGMLTFTADQPLVNTLDGPAITTGAGNQQVIYTAVLLNGTFGQAYPLQRGNCPPGWTVAVGVFPDIVWDPEDESFGLVARTFNAGGPARDTVFGTPSLPLPPPGANGPLTLDGDALVATYYPSMGENATWFVKDLDRDGERDWELAIAKGGAGDLCVVNTTHLERGNVDAGVRSYAALLEPEVIVDRFAVSDRHAPAGSTVKAMVDLRNVGLAPMDELPSFDVQMRSKRSVAGHEWSDVSVEADPTGRSARIVGSLETQAAGLVELQVAGAGRAWKERRKGRPEEPIVLDIGVEPPSGIACNAIALRSERVVTLKWENGDAYDSIRVYRDGHLVDILDGQATLFEDRVSLRVQPGEYEVRAMVGELMSLPGSAVCSLGGGEVGAALPFDCNVDGAVNIADPICLLGFLFGGEPKSLPCGDGSADDSANVTLMDWNGDDAVNISDGIAGLLYLFADGAEPVLGPIDACRRIQDCPSACE